MENQIFVSGNIVAITSCPSFEIFDKKVEAGEPIHLKLADDPYEVDVFVEDCGIIPVPARFKADPTQDRPEGRKVKGYIIVGGPGQPAFQQEVRFSLFPEGNAPLSKEMARAVAN